MGWQEDKASSDDAIPQVARLLGCALGPRIWHPALPDEDFRHGTDMVLESERLRVGVRVRTLRSEWVRAHYATLCGEFTIRASRPTGARTELAKLIDGDGRPDFYFYGFRDGPVIVHQLVYVVGVLVELIVRRGLDHISKLRHNADGTSFRIFRVVDLPAEAVLAFGPIPQPGDTLE